VPLLVAPHDTYGLLFALTPRNRYGLRGAARHIWSFGRYDNRRVSMCPIPGNIRRIRGNIRHGSAIRWPVEAIRWPVEEAPFCGPENPYIVSPVMPKRLGDARMGNRMRRSTPSTMRCSRPCEGVVRGKHKRYHADRRDKRPIHSIRHGTHQFVGY
jgi:hypothetical protein